MENNFKLPATFVKEVKAATVGFLNSSLNKLDGSWEPKLVDEFGLKIQNQSGYTVSLSARLVKMLFGEKDTLPSTFVLASEKSDRLHPRSYKEFNEIINSASYKRLASDKKASKITKYFDDVKIGKVSQTIDKKIYSMDHKLVN